jgi:hypothetical protein
MEVGDVSISYFSSPVTSTRAPTYQLIFGKTRIDKRERTRKERHNPKVCMVGRKKRSKSIESHVLVSHNSQTKMRLE